MPNTDPPRLHVALVHNHEASRNRVLVPQLDALCAMLGAGLTKVGWQPPVQPHSAAMRLYRDWRYYRLALGWSRYRGHGAAGAVATTREHFLGVLSRHRTADRRARMRRISRIETLVTAKHVAAWQAFLETDATHLLCCEDDLVFNPDSVDRLRALLASPALLGDLRYIDLAGGLDVAALRVDALVAGRAADHIRYAGIVTNTACCYLLPRELAAHFMRLLLGRPELRLVGIDWMINAMAMALRSEGVMCDALHFVPPVFGHGTFTGAHLSWFQAALTAGPQAKETNPS